MPAKTPASVLRAPRRRPGPLLLGALLGAACLTPSTAAAIPFAQRLSLRGEAMLSHVAGEPNSRYFGFGFFGSGRLGLTLVGPLSLQVAASVGVFPPAGPLALGTSVTATYTGGLRFEPRTVRPEGRLFIEANAGVAATGADFYRFAFDVGVGWELQVSRYLYLGPVFRYWHIYQPDELARTPDGQADAHYFSLGLSMHIRPSPPPRTRAGTLLAINAADAPDGDHDGVPDVVDDCPEVVEDHDGWRDDDGCPDLDDDEDNFPDSEDRCPRQSETPNSFEDEDGCPDTLPATLETVTRAEGQLRTLQRVYFPVSRAQIQPYVMNSLIAVARYLIEHPEVRRVRVEGHADDRGTRRAGFELSLRRAVAVVNFLTEQGVERGRLVPIGVGDLAPLEPPHDEVTRARNRRIEFAIEGEARPLPEGHWTLAAHPLSDLPGAR
jgi:outer membrane protein OmpA-like peptidoglycan-associated protein